MSAYAVALVLSSSLVHQVEAEAKPVDDVGVKRAISDLGDPRYRVRQKASTTLWNLGVAAEPALKEALKSDDNEVRLRAQSILDDFHYGILPTASPEILAYIRNFRDGEPTERQAAFEQLVSIKQYVTVQRLLALEKSPTLRRSFLMRLFQNDEAVSHFIEVGSIKKLIATVGSDQDAGWRQTVLSQLLFSAKFIAKLNDNNQISVLSSFIKEEKSPEFRRVLLMALFQNQTATKAVLKEEKIDFIFTVIKNDPDENSRGNLLNTLISNSALLAVVMERGELSKLLDFIRTQSSANMQKAIFARMFRSSSTIRNFLKSQSVDELLKLVSGTEDPETRGQLLAQLMGNSAVRQALTEQGKLDLIISTATDEKNRVARRAYLTQLFQTSILYSLSDAKMVSGLWKLIQDDDDEQWQSDVLATLFANSRFYQMLNDPKDVQWVVAMMRKSDQNTIDGMLTRILSNSQLQALMMKNEHFDTLWKMTEKSNAQARSQLLTRLVGSQTVAKHLIAEKQLDRLIDLVEKQDDRTRKLEVFRGLLRNYTAMRALIADGKYDTLFAMVKAVDDPKQEAELAGDFFRGSGVVGYIVKEKKHELLLTYLDEKKFSEEARSGYMSKLFSNTTAMNELIDKGHYERLMSAAQSIDDKTVKTTVLGRFLTHPKTVSFLDSKKQLDVLTKFLSKVDHKQNTRIVQDLVRNSVTVEALVKNGHLKDLLSWIQQIPQGYTRGSTTGSLLKSSNVVKLIIKNDDVKLLLDLVRQEKDSSARQNVLRYLAANSTTTGLLIDAGYFNDIMKLLQEQPVRERSSTLAYLIAMPKTLEWLQKHERLDSVFEIINSTTDVNIRRSMIGRLFGNRASIEFFIKHNHFDTMLDLATSEPQTNYRVQWLATLLSTNAALHELAERRRVDLLLDVVDTIGDANGRTVYLTRVIQSSTVVAALVKHDLIDALVRRCSSNSNDPQRGRMLAELLLSPAAIKELNDETQFKPFLKKVVEHKDKAVRVRFLQQISYRQDTLARVVKANYLDRIIKAMETDFTGATQRNYLFRLYASPKVVASLAKSEDIGRLYKLLDDEGGADQRRNLINTLCSNPTTLGLLLKAEGLDRLIQQIEREPAIGNRATLFSLMVSVPATVEYLLDRQELSRVFDILEESGDDKKLEQRIIQMGLQEPGVRGFADIKFAKRYVSLFETVAESSTSYVARFLDNTAIRQRLIASGQLELLQRVAKLEKDDAKRAAYNETILNSTTGAVPYAIYREDFETAENLLREHATSDLGMLRLASYLLVRDRLDDEITRLTKLLQAELKPHESRLLVYLLRANNDLEAAFQRAKNVDDAGMLKALAVERLDWSTAARLQSEDVCQLPVKIPNSERYDKYQPLERLGLQATYERLSGQDEKLKSTLKKMAELRGETDDKDLIWHSAEMLLVNTQFEDGLALLDSTHPQRAFDMHWYRNDYDKALAAIKWNPKDPQGWFDDQPVDSTNSTAELDRYKFALRVARLLISAGLEEQGVALFDVTETHADVAPTSGTAPQRSLREYLCRDLLLAGYRERAWKVGAKAVTSSTYPPYLLSRLYYTSRNPLRSARARSWWTLLRSQDSAASSEEILQRVDKIMKMGVRNKVPEFNELVEAAITHGPDVIESRRKEYWHGIGQTCYLMQEFDAARRCFAKIDDSVEVRLTLAHMLRKEEKWQEAQSAYIDLFEENRTKIAALYLAGDCMMKVGQREEGEKAKRMASLLPLNSRERHTLATELGKHGLKEDALQQWRIIRRVAPFEYWEGLDAARQIGLAAPDDPDFAADMWQQYVLLDVRPVFHFNENRAYLSVPFLLHKLRARAAIEDEDFEAAQKQIDVALSATMCETPLCEELVPALDAKGRTEMADALFNRMFDAYEDRIEKYPKSALLLNNIAWLCARSDRRLDDAAKYSQRSLALKPDQASYLDTYAEIQFRLGNRDQAIRFSEKAVEISPHQTNLREQLKRFKNDPLPKRGDG